VLKGAVVDVVVVVGVVVVVALLRERSSCRRRRRGVSLGVPRGAIVVLDVIVAPWRYSREPLSSRV
jgi:hypothetical protein